MHYLHIANWAITIKPEDVDTMTGLLTSAARTGGSVTVHTPDGSEIHVPGNVPAALLPYAIASYEIIR